MTPDRIKQLRALCDAATPGEWKAEPRHILQSTKEYLAIPPKYPHRNSQSLGPFFEADLLFIAAARAALPEALDEIERLRAKLAIATNALKDLSGHWPDCGISFNVRHDCSCPAGIAITALEQMGTDQLQKDADG